MHSGTAPMYVAGDGPCSEREGSVQLLAALHGNDRVALLDSDGGACINPEDHFSFGSSPFALVICY